MPAGADVLVSLVVGVALAAACGFRVFVPLLAIALGAKTGTLPISPGSQWLASDAAVVALGTATVLEIAAYYLPWLDHVLDLLAAPAATVAGIVAASSVFVEFPPFVRWTLAVVAGGGVAGAVHGIASVARLKSTALTGGVANPVLATGELLGAAVTSVLAIVAPVAAVLVVVLVLILLVRARRKRRRGTERVESGQPPA